MDHLKQLVKSMLTRKFIVAVLGAVLAFGNYMWHWGLTVDQVMTFLAPLLAFIGVEGVADIKARK